MSVKVINSGRVHDTVQFLGSGTVIIENGAQIRHNSIIEMADGILKIGENSVLGFFTMVQGTGEIVIGKETMIGPHCTLLASYHEMSSNPNVQKKLIRSYLRIGSNVWSGASVTFNCGITVYDNAVIGANSFVNKDVSEGIIVAGSPAKFIRHK